MHLIYEIVIGFIVGLVARAIMPGTQAMGLIFTTILGVVGSIVASKLGVVFGLYQDGSAAGFIGAVVGAVIVLFVYGLIKKN